MALGPHAGLQHHRQADREHEYAAWAGNDPGHRRQDDQDYAEHEYRPFDHRMVDERVPLFPRIITAMWAKPMRPAKNLRGVRPATRTTDACPIRGQGRAKSLLAACLPGILPPLDPAEVLLEFRWLLPVLGDEDGARRRRPIRSPQRNCPCRRCSRRAERRGLVEISLAHIRQLSRCQSPDRARGARSASPALETGRGSVAARPICTSPFRRGCNSSRR